MEIRIEYIISFAMAFIISFLATPLAKKIALGLGAVDIPNDDRRMHKKPMARLGGLAIIVGFFTVIIYFALTGGDIYEHLNSNQFMAYIMGAVIIIALGIIDDIKPLSSKLKFMVQIIAAYIVILPVDNRIGFITNPFGETPQPISFEALIIGISILWIVGITNAVNLIDGLDGLAAGVSAIAAISMFSVAVITNQPAIAVIIITLAGSTLGFLPYNFNPAKIFMGDTGSMFLGFTLAVLSIQGLMKTYAVLAIALPLLILGLPIFDTAFAIIRRVVNGKPIGEADRGHLHHRLIDMGLSHRQSVSVLYIISGSLGLVSITLTDKGLLPAVIFVILVSVFIVGGTRIMNQMDD